MLLRVEIEEINCRVEETQNKAKKFEKVEEKIPDLFAVAQNLQNENDMIKNDNVRLIMKIEKFDFNSRLLIYEELGFDINVFKNNTLI